MEKAFDCLIANNVISCHCEATLGGRGNLTSSGFRDCFASVFAKAATDKSLAMTSISRAVLLPFQNHALTGGSNV
jgi:hypothetical protein